jgi:hypothetical protein
MQLSNHVTLPKNAPHNRDYVECSRFPENGIAAKIEGALRRNTALETEKPSGSPRANESGFGKPAQSVMAIRAK